MMVLINSDFGIRQVAQLLGKTDDEQRYLNRSLFYRNVWNPAVVSDGFKGLARLIAID